MKEKLKLATLLLFAGFVAASLLPRLFITNANTDAISDNQSSNDAASVVNRLPEIQDLRHTEIGLGQRFTFGLEVIDEEGDNVRIELIEKPRSALFNQNTLTVDWTPQPTDGRNGRFVVKVTELPRDKSRARRTVTKEYNLQIVKRPVKLLELPPAPLEVDAFVTIIDPARLQAANK